MQHFACTHIQVLSSTQEVRSADRRLYYYLQMKKSRNSFLMVTVIIVTIPLVLRYRYMDETVQLVVTQQCHWEFDMKADKSDIETSIAESLKTKGNNSQMKYVVYECGNSIWTFCGGWSDRISGILSALIISILTKRRFAINFVSPVLLQDYLVPAHFDWQYNSTIIKSRTVSHEDLTNYYSNKIRNHLSGMANIDNYFKHDIAFLTMNWDFTEEYRKRPNIGCEIPWITKLQYADMYRQLFIFLFKPSPRLAGELSDFNRKQRRRPKTACAHIRIGGNIDMPFDNRRDTYHLNILWKYFDKLDKHEYDFFIASDASIVRNTAMKHFPENMIDTPGAITHIDQPSLSDEREGFLKQLLDFYILTKCDILVITRSGFGILAAYLRETDNGLYCWRGSDLRPCSRYTVHNTFPGEMLAH